MKNNRKVLSIALGGAMVPLGLATAAEHSFGQELQSSQTSVGRIGDMPSSTAKAGLDLLGEDVRPEAFRQNVVSASRISDLGGSDGVSPSYSNASYAIDNSMSFAPVAYQSDAPYSGSVYESVVGYSDSSNCGTGGCNTGSSCESGLVDLGWAEVDALLWWGAETRTQPIANRGPTGVRGAPATIPVVGGDQSPLGGDMMPGIRANFGFWLDDCQTMGVGGRFTTLLNGSTTTAFASNGETTLGIPFFNTSLAIPDTFLLAFAQNPNILNAGSISVENKTSFLQAEAYGKFLLARSKAARADLLGGYSFVKLDDSLSIRAETDLIQPQVFNDRFATKNTFHGGQIGFTTDISKGCWSFSTLSKVSLGNMRQEATVTGTGTNNEGFFARGAALGTQTRDVFTFLPEAGAKLRYQLTPKTMFNVGYSFLFFPDVARSSGLIDSNIDILNNPPAAPNPRFAHDSFYLHGIDLGLSINF